MIREGGMGVVYLARQRGLNRLVALKMIRGGEHARPDHFARFRIEAEAVARLSHPNIVQIYEIGEVDGLPFLSLELLERRTLEDRLAGTPQPSRQAADLMATLARAVQVAHDAGIIHRDLKPSNVLFTEDGIPKITDFGLAKRLESDGRQTESGQIMGTPCYMAPEQARGHTKDVGPAADVYALGAILYEMLTGRPPFKGETPIETVRQVIDDDPVPLSRLVPRVAHDLETICLKCLAKEPDRRYASAQALADDLERFLTGRPVIARRTPFWERGVKWARRRPAAAVLLSLAMVVFLSLPVGFAIREHNKLVQEAERSRWRDDRQGEGALLIDQTREADTQEALSKVEVRLATFRQTIEDETRLAGLLGRITTAMTQVDQKQKEMLAREANLEHERTGRARHQEFLRRRDQTFLHETQFTGLDLLSNQGKRVAGPSPRSQSSPRRARAISGRWGRCRQACRNRSVSRSRRVATSCS